MRRAVALLAVLLLSSLVTVPATVPAHAYQPSGGATFNTPVPWGSAAARTTIVRKVEKAIRNIRPTKSDPNPVLVIAAYLFDRPSSADAIIGACKRGVSVRVIIDDEVKSKPFRRIVTALNADNVKDRNRDGVPDSDPRTGPCNRGLPASSGGLRSKPVEHARVATGIPVMNPRQVHRSLIEDKATPVTWGKDGSYVLRCSGSCRGGPNANMHSKIYAFSSTGKAKNVVMFASTNLNAGGANKGWNDMITMKSRPKTFDFVVKMHRKMTAQKKAGRKLVQVVDGPYTTRFFPMYGVGKKRDPLMVDLRKVKCKSAVGRTQLWIQQFWWNGHRGNYIWEKIRSLAKKGCQVRIIVGAVDRKLLKKLKAARGSGLIELWDSRWDSSDPDGCVNSRTHMKALAIRGTYGKNKNYAGVWTGTANWATGSLTKGDEVTVNVRSAKLYNQYVARWKVVKNHSSLNYVRNMTDPTIKCID